MLSSATEVIGAWVLARAAKAELSTRRLGPSGRDLLSRTFSWRGESRVEPVDVTGESELKVDRDAADAARAQSRLHSELLLATNLANRDLGEKIALIAGGALATWFKARPETAAKLSVLVLLEIVSDVVKEHLYAASKIDVGRIRYNLRVPAVLAVAIAAGAACNVMFNAVQIVCFFGDDVSDALG